jgi:hypothetical protein
LEEVRLSPVLLFAGQILRTLATKFVRRSRHRLSTIAGPGRRELRLLRARTCSHSQEAFLEEDNHKEEDLDSFLECKRMINLKVSLEKNQKRTNHRTLSSPQAILLMKTPLQEASIE